MKTVKKKLLAFVLALAMVFPALSQAMPVAADGLADGTYTVPGLSTAVLSMYHFDSDSARVVVRGNDAWLITSINGAKEANTLNRFDGMAYGPQSQILNPSDETNHTLVEGTAVADVIETDNWRTFVLPVPKSVFESGGDIYYMLKYRAGYSDTHDGDWYKASGGDYYLTGYTLTWESDSTVLPGEAVPEADADYSAVDAALAAVPEDLSVYTDETAAAVTAAVDAVVRGKKASEQAEVDAMAAAITAAVEGLVEKQTDPAPPAEVYVTISNAGVLALAREKVTVSDLDADGKLTYDEALVAAHKAYCPNGVEGYITSGTMVRTLWGINAGGNCLFVLNNEFIRNGVTTDTVKADDELVAAIMSDPDEYFYTDYHSYFTESTKTVTAGESFTLTLALVPDDMMGLEDTSPAGLQAGTWANGTFTPINGAVAGEDGKVTLSFAEAGTYIVSASGTVYFEDWDMDCPIIAPVCKVTVEAAPEPQPEPIELTITNQLSMFKAVTASAVANADGSATLTFALSGTGYHYLYKGTYEQAVANGDAIENWIAGYQNDEGKWEFRVLVAADELGKDVPIVAVSQSYYEKYLNGQNSLARAFYPRQFNLDLNAATLVTDDFAETKVLAVTNNVKMFKVENTAELTTVGGPNSNGYKSDFILYMSNTTFDKAFIGTAEDAAQEGAATIAFVPDDSEKGTFTFQVMSMKTAGDPDSVETLIGKPFVISFHSSKGWYERVFTIDSEAGTVVIDPVATAAIQISVSVEGNVKLALQGITVSDKNYDGTVSVGEALTAVHEEFYEGGASGYATEMTSWGSEGICRFWGIDTGAVGYWKNNASCYSLDEALVKDDVLVAFVYKDATAWSDAYSRFDKFDYTSENGTLTVTLEKAGYDENWQTVFEPAAGASITVYDGDFNAVDTAKYTVTDNGDGSYGITFAEAGSYTLVATDTVSNIVPAVAAVTVEAVAVTPSLTSLSFRSGTAATATVYAMEPEFDPEVREYTFYLPDSATYAYAYAALAEGSEGSITLEYKNPSGGAAVTKTIGASGYVYATTLGASNSYVGQDVIVKIGGEEAYLVHVVRQATLSTGTAATGGLYIAADGTTLALTPAYNRTVYEYELNTPNSTVLTVAAKPTVSTGELTINGQAVDASAQVTVTPAWENRSFDLVITVKGEGARDGVYTIHMHEQPASLAVTTPPAKTVYDIGETFDPTGMVVTATYEDGEAVIVPAEDYTFAPDGALSLSDTVITISFSGMTAEQAISFNAPFDGSGTAEDPFQIKTAEDMQTLDNLVEGGEPFTGLYLKMINDIALTPEFNGVGAAGKPFSGDFDGGSHLLTVAEGGTAPFAYVPNSSIHDLDIYGSRIADYGVVSLYTQKGNTTYTFENVTLKSGTQTLKAGFLGGYASGSDDVTITNCTIEENVVIGYNRDQDWIGSFGGEFNGTITNSVSYATVYGVNFVGGIVADKGQTMGTFKVENCTFGGTVVGTGNYVGGIVGSGYAGTRWGMNSAWSTPGVTIKNCTMSGSVTGGIGVGGILGGEGAQAQAWDNGPTYIQDNSVTGTVSGTQFVGGVIGYMLSLNKNSYITHNYYSSACGVPAGIGGVGGIDTTGHEAGMIDGVFYFSSSTADGTTAAEIRDLVPGHALDSYITITTLGSAGYKNQFKVDHNRTDDPLGTDRENLCYTDELPAITVTTASLTLKGDIGVNIFAEVPEAIAEDEGAYAVFSFKDADSEPILISDALQSDGRYEFTYRAAAKEMSEQLVLKFYNCSGIEIEADKESGGIFEGYSVAAYVSAVMAGGTEEGKVLVTRLASFGAYAMKYFNYTPKNEVSEELAALITGAEDVTDVTSETLADYAVKDKADNLDGIDVKGISLTLEALTTLNLSYALSGDANIGDYTFTVNGEPIEVFKSDNDGKYYVRIPNIAAKNLGDEYTVVVTGEGGKTLTLTCSALTYARNILAAYENKEKKTDVCNMVRALYQYYKAAESYPGFTN